MPISRLYNAAAAGRKHRHLTYDKNDSGNFPVFEYGKFSFDKSVDFEGLKLEFVGSANGKTQSGFYHYKRDICGWTYESHVSAKNGVYYLQPIEPLNLPDNVTDFIEIQFKEITIEPEGSAVIFLTMPIEIGVFLESNDGERALLDIVTFCHPKFSLYGIASRGVITRFHESEVYAEPPVLKNYQEGLLRLEIENNTREWARIGRVVLYQKGLTLYHDDRTVSACAKMIVQKSDVADVFAYDLAIRDGMTECLQVFESRKTTPFCNIEGALLDTTFTMDMGMR